jgi:NADH:ubiquinone oxidoreductase subunit 5 (subunit L)/multisubunit Na+/H+ antiporter MnhA subunit
MSAIDWLRILYGFSYCLRWSIALVMVMFATKPQKKTSQPGSAKRANMLRRLIATMLIVGVLISQAIAQQTEPATGVARVHEGTLLKLATLSPLDHSTAKRGDDVPLVLTRPL